MKINLRGKLYQQLTNKELVCRNIPTYHSTGRYRWEVTDSLYLLLSLGQQYLPCFSVGRTHYVDAFGVFAVWHLASAEVEDFVIHS